MDATAPAFIRIRDRTWLKLSQNQSLNKSSESRRNSGRNQNPYKVGVRIKNWIKIWIESVDRFGTD